MRFVFLLSGRELALDAARVGATVQNLKECLRDVYGFPVCLQELLSGRIVLSGGIVLTDLLASCQENLLMLLTSIKKCDHVSMPDVVREDLVQAAALGWIDMVHCLLLAGMDVNERLYGFRASLR